MGRVSRQLHNAIKAYVAYFIVFLWKPFRNDKNIDGWFIMPAGGARR